MNEYDDIPKLLRARADRRGLSVIDYTADCGLDRVAADEIERLRKTLQHIAILDDPQLGGIPKRGSLSKIALTALGEETPFEDWWDNA